MAPSNDRGRSFSVDIKGLLAALTEQFPEPLLCVRELIQNAADAGAQRIEVDVAFDSTRSLFRLAVRDDGRGMSRSEIEGYLTIGFSEKDPQRDRGRFGVGKLSPYSLGIARMVVETATGESAHRLVFNGDGSGVVNEIPVRARGTVVRVYKDCERGEAERLAERTFQLVEERCGSIRIPLYVNGQSVNREIALPTAYAVHFSGPEGDGVIGISAEPTQTLMGGRIVLETGAPILGPDISYILDSPRLAPTLSRNAVRRDGAFESLLRVARVHLEELTTHVARQLASRVRELRQAGSPVERELEPDDRAAMEWLRSQLLEPDTAPDDAIRAAPVLETADGGLVSANDLIEIIRKEGRVPSSRVPRLRDEFSGYADRGVPVLLLYSDLEDFLDRQGIETVEVDGQDEGLEIERGRWSPGEQALASRPALSEEGARRRRRGQALRVALAVSLVVGLGLGLRAVVLPESPRSPTAPSYALGPGSEAGSPYPIPEAGPIRELPAASASELRASVTSGGTEGGRRPFRTVLLLLTSLGVVLTVALALSMIYLVLRGSRRRPTRWLRAEAGAPLTVGQERARRLDVLSRALFHPIDFFVARGWSIRSSGARSLGAGGTIKGYRELAPEPPIRSGVRLDLDRITIGFVDLVSNVGEPHDGRILLRRHDRVLLNRNHPTVRDLIAVAERDSGRARVLLDALLATDPELARGTDPRQAEWDLLGRAELSLRGDR